ILRLGVSEGEAGVGGRANRRPRLGDVLSQESITYHMHDHPIAMHTAISFGHDTYVHKYTHEWALLEITAKELERRVHVVRSLFACAGDYVSTRRRVQLPRTQCTQVPMKEPNTKYVDNTEYITQKKEYCFLGRGSLRQQANYH